MRPGTLPPLEPGTCLSCGGTRWPVTHGRCSLCAAAFGPASAPVHIRDLLQPVMDSIEALQRTASQEQP